MLTLSYVCIGLSVFSLLLVIKIVRYKDKKRILRYHGVTEKNHK